jgi:FkbM family methyltransferase
MIAEQGGWAKVETALVLHVVRDCVNNNDKSSPPPLVVDVGAHLGYFSLLSLSLGANVVAFEPSAEHRPFFSFSAALNNVDPARVHVVPFPASDEATVEFDGWSTAAGMQKITLNGDPSAAITTIPARRVDSEVEAASASASDAAADINTSHAASIAWMKLDVEGAELSALNSASRLFDDRGPTSIPKPRRLGF